MTTALTFEKFRGFPDLTVSPVKRVNLIAGANNTGKTGILEGLYLLWLGDSAQATKLPSLFRSSVARQAAGSDDFPTFWQALFYDKQTSSRASVSARVAEGVATCRFREGAGGIGFSYELTSVPVDPSPARQMIDQAVLAPTFSITPERLVESHFNQNPFATKLIVVSTKPEDPVGGR